MGTTVSTDVNVLPKGAVEPISNMQLILAQLQHDSALYNEAPGGIQINDHERETTL